MAKLVRIDDRKPLEIFAGRKTQGPIQMRLDESVIGRLLRSHDGAKNMYAINPNDKNMKVRLTLVNYMIPEKELFIKPLDIKPEKEVPVPEKKEETPVVPEPTPATKKEEVVEPVTEEKKEVEEVTETPVPEKEEADKAPMDALEKLAQELAKEPAKEEEKVETKDETVDAEEKEEPVSKNNYNINKKQYNNKKHK